MTVSVQDSVPQDNKPTDKELNFRKQEAYFKQQLEQERAARLAAEQKVQEVQQRQHHSEDDDDDSEPYVDKKKLQKTLNKFGEQAKAQTQSDIQRAVQTALYEERKQNWVKNNPDFYDVLQHAETFAKHDPELAETILEMPEGFERQKLVYKNIKALGLHKPQAKAPSIQEKIDQNRRSPFYQPSGVGNPAPSQPTGDFSKQGRKNAYDHMLELKKRLRI